MSFYLLWQNLRDEACETLNCPLGRQGLQAFPKDPWIKKGTSNTDNYIPTPHTATLQTQNLTANSDRRISWVTSAKGYYHAPVAVGCVTALNSYQQLRITTM